MTNNVVEVEKVGTEDKKRSTKITAIIILGVVFALALFILVSSFATVGLNPGFVSKPDVIYIYKAGATNSSGILPKDDERYDEFMKYYDEMFSSSFLSALFNGRLSGYSISEPIKESSTSNITKEFTNAYVRFSYDEPIALTNKNGEEYKKESNTSKKITFKDLYFEVDETNSMQSYTMYVIDYESTQTKGKITYCKVNLVANTSKLAEKLGEFHNSIKA